MKAGASHAQRKLFENQTLDFSFAFVLVPGQHYPRDPFTQLWLMGWNATSINSQSSSLAPLRDRILFAPRSQNLESSQVLRQSGGVVVHQDIP